MSVVRSIIPDILYHENRTHNVRFSWYCFSMKSAHRYHEFLASDVRFSWHPSWPGATGFGRQRPAPYTPPTARLFRTRFFMSLPHLIAAAVLAQTPAPKIDIEL